MVKILVTGGNGQLGSELKEIAPDMGSYEFVFTDIDNLDICNLTDLEHFFSHNKIAYIINCAAYTAVDKAESDPETARKVNVEAVGNLSKMANTFKCRLIHISTDYVFDSSKQQIPFKESDGICAQSVYGKTKAAGEQEALKAFECIIIRTSWLYSTYGANFVKTILRLANERPELRVIFDQVGTPCYAADLAMAIRTILDYSENNQMFKSGIYHFSNEGVCSWYDFAHEIVTMAGLNCTVKPIETKDYPLPAIRPFYSVMNKAKIKETFGISISHWREGLLRCYNKLGQK
jgi:dTDP-4-dehydrorhamnose reductase